VKPWSLILAEVHPITSDPVNAQLSCGETMPMAIGAQLDFFICLQVEPLKVDLQLLLPAQGILRLRDKVIGKLGQ